MARSRTEYCPSLEEIYGSFEAFEKNDSSNFDEYKALAKLLVDGVLFVGDAIDGPFFSSNSKEAGNTISLSVNCNDIFAWACADAEPITCEELPQLYLEHAKNPSWGAIKWCAKKRNIQPQSPVIRDMKKEGVWDDEMERLKKNRE